MINQNIVMKKESKSDLKSNLVTGVASSVGAVGGFVATDVIAGEVVSVEDQAYEDSPNVYETNVPGYSGRSEQSDDPVQASQSVHGQVPESEQVSAGSQQELAHDESPEVSVLEYQTVETESGEQIDVAITEVDGAQSVLADVNNDGVAEVLASDLNGDGRLDGNELAYVQEQDLSADEDSGCQPDAVLNDDSALLAQNDAGMGEGMDMFEGDYVNDADVDAFIA